MKKFMAMTFALFLSACSNSQMDPGQAVGTAVGALIGGYAGGQFGGGAGQMVFMAIGGTLGATAGYIGKRRLADREAGSLTRCCKCHDVEMRGHPHLDRVGRIL